MSYFEGRRNFVRPFLTKNPLVTALHSLFLLGIHDQGSPMYRHFGEQLSQLKERLLYMGSVAEKAVNLSVEGLSHRNENLATEVIARHEPEINGLQIEIDNLALQLLALQQPMAVDLRVITSAMKINSDLERVGDQAVNIAQRVLSIISMPDHRLLVDIPQMAELAQQMVKDSLDSYVRQDVGLAREILLRDDQVDRYRDQIFGELIAYMIKFPARIQFALDMLLISRSLERIGDHATNIAEDVIYMVQGEDIRHHAGERASAGKSSS
jgi:phosphate transport system protein